MGARAFTVRLSGLNTSLDVGISDTVTITINNEDTAPTAIALSLNPTSAAEGVTTTVTVTAAFPGSVTLTTPTEVTITVGDPGDMATEGTDYTVVDDFTVTLDPGATSGTGTFQFVVEADALFESNETVTISGTAVGFDPITPVTLVIDEQDVAPTEIVLSLSETAVTEGDSDQTITVTATLSPASVTLVANTVVTVAVGEQRRFGHGRDGLHRGR